MTQRRSTPEPRARRVDQLLAKGIRFRVNSELAGTSSLIHSPVSLTLRDSRLGPKHNATLTSRVGISMGSTSRMEYLVQENRHQAGKTVDNHISTAGRDGVVLGGGDTGLIV